MLNGIRMHRYIPMTWLSISIGRLLRDAGCGMMVISSLIFNGFSNESPALLLVTVKPLPPIDLPLSPLLLDDELFFLLSTDFFATVLWAEYTWFSNCLYMPNVAVHTVHLYDKCAGFSVILCSRDTWFNSFHWYIWNGKEIKIKNTVITERGEVRNLLVHTLDNGQHLCLC